MRNLVAWTFVLLINTLAAPLNAQDAPAGPPPAANSADANKSERRPSEQSTEEGVTQAGPLPGHSYHGEVFDEGPRQKAYLMPGMPKIHFPVTTKSPEAQSFIQQGVGQLHGFWYYEAERSFRQAAVFDKECAMAYWGMALANIDNLGRAKKFMVECGKYKQGISDREKMYVEAADAYFKADANKRKERNEAYTKALERILYKFPEDIEARSLLALQLWKNRDGGTPIGSFLSVDALLDQIFRADSVHPAHHYRIHLWDAERAENGLSSAALCGQSSAGIAHMWHMPGHIYSKLKRYEDACWQQEASARVDHAHMLRDRVMPDQIHNYAHNNEWLIRDMFFVGRMRDAIELAKNMCELPRHPKYNTFTKGSSRFGRMRLFEALTRFEAWDELIALCDTPYLEPTDNEDEQIRRLRYLGAAHYRRGNTAQGDMQLAALEVKLTNLAAAQDAAVAQAEQMAKDSSQDDKALEKAKSDARKSTERKISDATKAVDELRGHKAVAATAFKGGLELLRKAGGVDQDYLAWVQFKAAETDKALEAARSAVRSRKNEVIPLSRLVELQWLAGKKEDAKASLEQLRALSNSIDKTAPLYARIAAIASELGYPADWKVDHPPAPDTGIRPPLDWLGPLRWRPSAAPAWTLPDVDGRDHALADYHGKPVVVIFFLGHGCLHCAQQLQAFGRAAKDFAAAGIDIIAISSDDASGLKRSVESYQGGDIPVPLVADYRLDTFKSYRCYDDFEQQPLHGTFFIDGSGLIRWQDISYEPFQDTTFLLAEAQRLLGQAAVAGRATFSTAHEVGP